MCVIFVLSILDPQKRVFQQVYIKCLCFKTNRDEKLGLSSEIEVSQVEKVPKNLDFLQIPYVNYIGNLEEISEFHHFFNFKDLYLRAQTIFFITVCFKS